MKACVFTLGCKMNEAESASLMRALEGRGYETTEEPGYADVYFLNTCAVTAEAERKSRQAVARLRKFNPAAPVIVFGCASQRDPSAFSAREGVTFVAGAMRKDRLPDLIGAHGTEREEERAFCELPAPKRTRTRALLRVQDGCDRFCSYCIIPYLRGRSRSRGWESIVEEARASDAKEIVLTGVDLSSYRDGETDLAALLVRLGQLPARIRLGSLEAGAVTDRLLDAVEGGNVAPHFHLSLQSGSTRVLRAMNRRYSREEYLGAVRKIYGRFPRGAVTTDIIVGYPTETEEDFLQSLSIVKEANFLRVHAFPFSPRAGTAAAKLRDLPAEVKRERMARMAAACAEQEARFLTAFEGEEAVALFESEGGYTEQYIRVEAEGAREGMLARVRLTERREGGFGAVILEEYR